MLRLASAALAAASLALVAAAPAAAQTAPATCPTFTVLHDDRIGALSLPAGPYTITINTPGALSCAQASSLFTQFLQDFDGRLPGGWRVNARTSTFSRTGQSFSVAPGRAPAPPSPQPQPQPQPPFDGRCPGTFQVLHDDQIDRLQVPAGQYTIDLLSDGRFGCRQAARQFARFLRDFDGVLPGRWRLDAQTATFTRGRRGPGFRIEPVVTRRPQPKPAVPTDAAQTCPPFRVLHNDMVGPLRLPAGPYTLIPLRGSGLSCTEASALFRQFLAAAQNALPAPWVVDAQTATFTRGRSGSVGFRVEPAS